VIPIAARRALGIVEGDELAVVVETAAYGPGLKSIL